MAAGRVCYAVPCMCGCRRCSSLLTLKLQTRLVCSWLRPWALRCTASRSGRSCPWVSRWSSRDRCVDVQPRPAGTCTWASSYDQASKEGWLHRHTGPDKLSVFLALPCLCRPCCWAVSWCLGRWHLAGCWAQCLAACRHRADWGAWSRCCARDKCCCVFAVLLCAGGIMETAYGANPDAEACGVCVCCRALVPRVCW